MSIEIPENAIIVIFWGACATLGYVYAGYPVILWVVALIWKRPIRKKEEYRPSVTVIVAAFDEGEIIARRLENLLSLEYAKGEFDILVASDGSRDDTVAVVRSYADRGVRCLDYKENRGRALTHNEAVREARGEIILFTDAATIFEKNFLQNLMRNYADSQVGAVVGRLLMRSSGSVVSRDEGLYFRYELAIRSLEDRIGILTTGTGACFSVRRTLYRPLTPIDDTDFTTPIDTIQAGFRVCYESSAVAYDWAPVTSDEQIRNRARMTAKNLVGTLRRCGVKFFFRHPGAGISIISHKLLRWLTGYLLLVAFFSNLALIYQGILYQSIMIAQGGFYLLALAGYLVSAHGRCIPLGSTIFSFLTAVYGMSIGVFNALLGRIPVKWTKVPLSKENQF